MTEFHTQPYSLDHTGFYFDSIEAFERGMQRLRAAGCEEVEIQFIDGDEHLAELAHADTLSGRVVRVTDGDTIVVLARGNTQHKIRLTGINAPERGQVFGTKSKEHLSDLVAGKTVDVDYDKLGRYQRILGKVLLNDQDMNLEQIKAGLAWHYKKYQGEQTPSDRALYSDYEIEARLAGRGLWHDPVPVPPWEYRKLQRN